MKRTNNDNELDEVNYNNKRNKHFKNDLKSIIGGLKSNKSEQVLPKMSDLDLVKKDGLHLKNIKEQTREIALTAVRQNGEALEFVINKTKEIILEAIKKKW